jgi:hypothetical protein
MSETPVSEISGYKKIPIKYSDCRKCAFNGLFNPLFHLCGKVHCIPRETKDGSYYYFIKIEDGNK